MHAIDPHSLLRLIRAALTTEDDNEREDALKQLNDVLVDHGMERVERPTLYFSGNYDLDDEDGSMTNVDTDSFCCPLEMLAFKRGIERAPTGGAWPTLQRVPKRMLAASPQNHALLAAMSEAAKRELLGSRYEEYRACRREPPSAVIDLDVAAAATRLVHLFPRQRLCVSVQNADTLRAAVTPSSLVPTLAADLPITICVHALVGTASWQLVFWHNTELCPGASGTGASAACDVARELHAELRRRGAKL